MLQLRSPLALKLFRGSVLRARMPCIWRVAVLQLVDSVGAFVDQARVLLQASNRRTVASFGVDGQQTVMVAELNVEHVGLDAVVI